MGVFVHITRRKAWAARGEDITAEEWQDFVRRDRELRMPGLNGPDFADYIPSSGPVPQWLWWTDGEVCAQNPDPLFLAKMKAIAKDLGAAVRDDEGKLIT